MCPVESPTGAEAAPAPRIAEPRTRPGFDRTAAAQIVGLAPSTLNRWERLFLEVDFDLGSTLAFADLVALAVLSTTVRCLGAGADEFAVGLARVFEALRDRADAERLDRYVALVGRDRATIVEGYDHQHSAEAGILVIPLRPILAGFRSQAFA